jgi:ABC-type spermidine/putrescine transport system permease subunit I
MIEAALRAVRGPIWLLLPVALLYCVFAVLPIGMILAYSLADGGAHYHAVLKSRLLLRITENTIIISLTTTVVAVLLGFLLAAALWRARPAMRAVLLAFILLPFWTAVLIKNFAWATLLQDNGLINSALQALGLTDAPVTLLHNRLAVIIGMVHYVLPYAVVPIYTALRGIDPRVERAARSLGAGTPSLVWWVVLPLSLPGVAAASLLSFIVSAGFFITPVILGAPSDMMISNLVNYYVHELVDFNGGAVLAVLILVALVPAIIVQQRLAQGGQHGPA